MGWTYDDYDEQPDWWLQRGLLYEDVLAAEIVRRRENSAG